jgi:hypothetical protein
MIQVPDFEKLSNPELIRASGVSSIYLAWFGNASDKNAELNLEEIPDQWVVDGGRVLPRSLVDDLNVR